MQPWPVLAPSSLKAKRLKVALKRPALLLKGDAGPARPLVIGVVEILDVGGTGAFAALRNKSRNWIGRFQELFLRPLGRLGRREVLTPFDHAPQARQIAVQDAGHLFGPDLLEQSLLGLLGGE